MLPMRSCEKCGADYQPRKATSSYCSKRCSNLARWDAGIIYGERYSGSEPWAKLDYQRHRADILARRRREYAEHPEKQAARNLARKRTPVEPCEVVGCGKPGDRHHDDYARPLDVRYLCRSHHITFHKRTA